MNLFHRRDAEPYINLDFIAAPAEPNPRSIAERRDLLIILLDEEIALARAAKNMRVLDRLLDHRITVMELAGTAIPVIPGRQS